MKKQENKKVCLAEKVPFYFPFSAEMLRDADNNQHHSQAVTVLGYSRASRRYFRVELESGDRVIIASAETLSVQVA